MDNVRLNYEDFLTVVKELLEKKSNEKYGAGTVVTVEKIYKANQSAKMVFCIREKFSNISPVIYTEKYYEEYKSGMEPETVVDRICREYDAGRCAVSMDTGSFAKWESAADHVYLRLVNTGRNEELLKELPHRDFFDMSVIYYLEFDNILVGNGTAMIFDRQLAAWKIKEDDLYRVAWENTYRKKGCQNKCLSEWMEELLIAQIRNADSEISHETAQKLAAEFRNSLYEMDKDPIYLMTNQDQFYGASVILFPDYLEEFAAKCGGNYYILPVSIHEVLLVSADSLDYVFLRDALEQINRDQEREEGIFLSDRVYCYDSMTGRIVEAED